MKHFRLNFALLLVAVAVMAALAMYLFLRGMWPQATFALIAGAVCACALFRLVWKLINVMSTFVNALEMNDTTMTFDFGGDDRSLRGMTESMNRIVELYHTNMREIETGKLYYDRILRVMTHEMRNSITPIIALASDMERHPGKYSDAELGEALAVISGQSRGIKRFLDSYYQLTHLPAPAIEKTDAREFFSRLKKLTAIEATERGLDAGVCDFTIGKGMTLEIDSALMSQALINLVRNALDAVRGNSDAKVTVSVSVADGRPYIVVADNGTGIVPEIRDSLFQPFMTTKPGGSGVGLCLSRQIVRQHGGELRVLSTSHSGTSFAITLP